MKKIKAILPVITLALLMALVFGMTTAQAVEEGDITHEVNFGDGFFCLHPHRHQQGPMDAVEMEAVSSEHYTGYPQEKLDMFAAFIMLQMDYYYATGGEDGGVVINNDAVQALIWNEICTVPEHVSKQDHLRYGIDPYLSKDAFAAERQKRVDYLNYVKAHIGEVQDNYSMTIWVSHDENFQDILELRLLEKTDEPTMEKKVRDCNDTDNYGDSIIGWQDGADYDIGDSVPFQITATMKGLPNFKNYYLEFVDHMEHLAFDPDSLEIWLTNAADAYEITEYFTVSSETEGYATDLSFLCEDIYQIKKEDGTRLVQNGDQIVVRYNAVLKPDAVYGNPGNENKAYMIYTRASGTADKGVSLPDIVKVFTYRLIIDKTDPNGNPLTGAAFQLSKKLADGSYQNLGVIGAVKNTDGTYTLTEENRTHFEWNGIDDGTYLLEEVVTPTGYNTMMPLEFWVKAEHDHKAETPMLYYLNTDYDGFDGFFDSQWFEGAASVSGYIGYETGEMSAQIVNNAGAVLPSTGGMGTDGIYLLGSVLVLAAGAVIVLNRKRA